MIDQTYSIWGLLKSAGFGGMRIPPDAKDIPITLEYKLQDQPNYDESLCYIPPKYVTWFLIIVEGATHAQVQHSSPFPPCLAKIRKIDMAKKKKSYHLHN